MAIADREQVGFWRRMSSSPAVMVAAVAGGVIGGVVGVVIPIPVVGSLIGSALGTAVGGAVGGLVMNTLGYRKDRKNIKAENQIISRLNEQLNTQGAQAQLGHSLQNIVDLGFRPAFVKHVAEQLKQEALNAKINLSVEIARSPHDPVLNERFNNWDRLYNQASEVISSTKLMKKDDSRKLVSQFMKSDGLGLGMTTDHITAHRYVPSAHAAVPLPHAYQPPVPNRSPAPPPAPSPNAMHPGLGLPPLPYGGGYSAQQGQGQAAYPGFR